MSENAASVIMREINVGFQGEPGVVAFGVDQSAPDTGFRVCGDCGITSLPGKKLDEIQHRPEQINHPVDDRYDDSRAKLIPGVAHPLGRQFLRVLSES